VASEGTMQVLCGRSHREDDYRQLRRAVHPNRTRHRPDHLPAARLPLFISYLLAPRGSSGLMKWVSFFFV